MFIILDDDSLLHVLLRTCHEDHDALWHTCRDFRQMLDSKLFREQRVISEWAMVEAVLWTGRQLFEFDNPEYLNEENREEEWFVDVEKAWDESSLNDDDGWIATPGAIENKFDIRVDGQLVGRGEYVLVARTGENVLWGTTEYDCLLACDEVSHELQAIGWLFFNKDGKLRLPKVYQAEQQALLSRSQHRENNIFFVKQMYLIQEYRKEQFSWIGACVLRSLLMNSKYKYRWSIALYEGEAHAQTTLQDREQYKDLKMRIRGTSSPMSHEEKMILLPEITAFNNRMGDLAKDNIRPFLRAGFVQAPETIPKSSNRFHVFCLPEFIEQTPVLTHDQSIKIKIIDQHDFAPVGDNPFGIDEDLHCFIITSCSKQINLLQEQDEALQAEDITRWVDLRRMVIQHDCNVREEVCRFIEGGASIKDSHALHACAANHAPGYIELLLELIPASERALALNRFDEKGSTPLMLAASSKIDRKDPEWKYHTAKTLIDLGADKSITNRSGETALGTLRSAKRYWDDFRRVFSLPPRPEDAVTARVHSALELLLCPENGPTAADRAILTLG